MERWWRKGKEWFGNQRTNSDTVKNSEERLQNARRSSSIPGIDSSRFTSFARSSKFFSGKQFVRWFRERADSAHAKFWLAALSFTEASIFIVPPDPLLAAIVLVHRGRWIWYVAFTTIFSVFGALFGYVIGAVLFDTIGVRIVEFYGLATQMEHARNLIGESVFIFTLTTAFTPIPFKVAVLAAGFARADIALFLLATIIGRFLRYGVVALAAKTFGEHGEVLLKRFWWAASLIALLGLALYAWYLLH